MSNEEDPQDELSAGDETPTSLPPWVRLLLGLLPIDVDAFIDFLKGIHREARNTSWDSLFRRGASIGISLAAIGLLLGMALFLLEGTDTSDIPVGVTTIYWGFLILFFFLAFSKWMIKQMQNINEAKSPIGHTLDDQWGVFLELSLGGILLLFPTYLIYTAIRPIDVLLLFALGAMLSGATIAGIALILSASARINNQVRNNNNYEETTLEEFSED